MIHPRVGYHLSFFYSFFFNDTATTEIYTLSLHDALPISTDPHTQTRRMNLGKETKIFSDRKSTRLNSSHITISYAVFCLKKKNKQQRKNKKNPKQYLQNKEAYKEQHQ